jgi:colicin import membrane protein
MTDTTAENAQPVTCAFPTGCSQPPEPKDPSKTGPAPIYCVDPEHNPLTAYRAKRKMKAAAKGGSQNSHLAVVEDLVDSDTPVTDAVKSAADLRTELVEAAALLQEGLPRYIEELRVITDPEAAEAQIMAINSDAETRVAEAGTALAKERSLRTIAEQAVRVAEATAANNEKAAELAIDELDTAKQKFQADVEKLQADAAQQIADIEEAKETALAEAAQQIEDAREEVRKAKEAAELAVAQAHADADAKVAEIELAKETALAEAAAKVDQALADAEAQRELATAAEEAKTRAERAAAEETAAAKASVDRMRKELETEVEGQRARFNTELAGQSSRFNTELQEQRTRMNGELEEQQKRAVAEQTRLQGEVARLQGELTAKAQTRK